jgi:hypothetical protein
MQGSETMKHVKSVAGGAVEVKRAVDRLGVAVKRAGVDSTRAKKAAEGVSQALKAETKLVQHESRFAGNDREAQLVRAQQQLAHAGTSLSELAREERQSRIAKMTPPGTEWADRDSFLAGSGVSSVAQQLQKRADASGKPQGYLFNERPLIATPGGNAEAAVESWQGFGTGKIGVLGSRAKSLGFEAETKADKLADERRAARKERLEQLTPPGTEWANSNSFRAGSDVSDVAQELQQRADATGKPQGYWFNETPLFGLPGGNAKAAVEAWEALSHG